MISNVRETQHLRGRLAMLSCFIAKSADRSLPFFRVLKGTNPFRWREAQQRAFDDLKAHLQHPATLLSLEPGSPLLLYIATTGGAVSGVLVEEHSRSGHLKQTLVYYVSEALSSAKVCYSELEKMIYAVVMATRKLRHYFTAHQVTVPTTFPLRGMLANRETTGWINKWAAKLAPLDLTFVARSAIKSQALADFLVEWTSTTASPRGEAPPPV